MGPPSLLVGSPDLGNYTSLQPCLLPHPVASSMAATAPVQNETNLSDALKDIRTFARQASFEHYDAGVKICKDKEGTLPFADALEEKLSALLRQVRIAIYIFPERPRSPLIDRAVAPGEPSRPSSVSTARVHPIGPCPARQHWCHLPPIIPHHLHQW